MTPHEKAIDLRDRYCKAFGMDHIHGQQAAIIAAEELVATYLTSSGKSYWRRVIGHLKESNLNP